MKRSRPALTLTSRQQSGPEQLFALAFARAPIATVLCDIEGTIIDLNEAFTSLFGWSRSEMVGSKISSIVHPLDLSDHLDRLKGLRDGTEERFTNRRRYLTSDGRMIWGENAVSLIREMQGGPIIIAQIQDMTAEHLASTAVREHEHQLHAIVDNSAAVVFVKDLEGRYLLVNRRFETLHRLLRTDVLGKTDAEIFPRRIARSFRRHDQAVLQSGEELQTEEDLQFGEEVRTFISMKFPLRNLEGQISAVCGVSTDITRRKRAENRMKVLNERLVRANDELKAMQMQLIQAEKLESIGRLAAGVAHEVKNPLAILQMGVDYLACSVPETDENIPGILQDMREAITRAEKIIVGMVDFSSNRQLALAECDLNRVIGGTLLLTRHQFTRKSIRIRSAFDKSLPPIQGDTNKLEQVILNVLLNAVQAMKKGGCITVTTYSRILGEEDRKGFGSRTANPFRAGDRVVVAEIEDDGPGIPPECLPKIYDPFFTTKPTGEGTGLGLSVVRRIVELHEGAIIIANHPPPQTGIKVTLTFKAQKSRLGTKKTANHQ